jgi:thiamine-monophosphate kinase
MGDTVGALGEFGLIDAVTARMPLGSAVLLGPGDDAAVVAAPDGRVVASTDMLVEGRHFRRDWSSAEDIGAKAAAVNLADITAMGAVPTALLVGLGAPPDLPVAWAEGLADGLRLECERAGASVAGGDVVRADVVTLGITALGDLQGRAPVQRAGARVGDVVAVAGRLGWAEAGLAVLSRGFRSPRALIEAHRRAQPDYGAGPQAADLGAHAMCDVSDGLVQDLGHIASASGVAVSLDAAAFEVAAPLLDVGRALGVDPLRWVLAGGEDGALVACFPPSVALPAPWRPVGRVLAGEGVFVAGRTPAELAELLGPAAGGHEHFRR